MFLKNALLSPISLSEFEKSKKNNNQSHKSEEQTKLPGIDKSTRS